MMIIEIGEQIIKYKTDGQNRFRFPQNKNNIYKKERDVHVYFCMKGYVLEF